MILLYVILNIFVLIDGEDSPIVQTRYGPVIGLTQTSRAGKIFYSFRKIPYAKPPLGNLRFKSPEKPNNWADVYDARENGPKCIQKNYFFYQNPPLEGSEDCLYLNVYTRRISKRANLPVMVFIHYGGLVLGSGRSSVIGPDYLMNEEIVFVSFNYRLGVFGFYSTVDDASPGNYGYKDMVLALKWVQDNINNFGGDKHKVTIFGQSIGGVAVHYLILSPAGNNLFHRAISESGTALNIWAYPLNELQKQVAIQQALLVNCTTIDNFAMVDCLRQIPADVLIESAKNFIIFSNEPSTIFSTVIEVKSRLNPEPFLTESPMDIMRCGNFNQVPWITGITSDDGIIKVSPLVRQSNTLKLLNANFDTIGPQLLLLPLSVQPDQVQSLWNDLINFYFNGQHFVNSSNPISVQQFINFYTDRGFAYGAYQSVLLQAAESKNPVWLYNFNYRGKLSYGDLVAATNETIDFNWGVSHCDDLLYLFNTPEYFPPLLIDDLKMSQLLVKLWTNFAIFGVPSVEFERSCGRFRWPPVPKLSWPRHGFLPFLNITNANTSCRVKFAVAHDFYSERMHFWEDQSILENQFLLIH